MRGLGRPVDLRDNLVVLRERFHATDPRLRGFGTFSHSCLGWVLRAFTGYPYRGL